MSDTPKAKGVIFGKSKYPGKYSQDSFFTRVDSEAYEKLANAREGQTMYINIKESKKGSTYAELVFRDAAPNDNEGF